MLRAIRVVNGRGSALVRLRWASSRSGDATTIGDALAPLVSSGGPCVVRLSPIKQLLSCPISPTTPTGRLVIMGDGRRGLGAIKAPHSPQITEAICVCVATFSRRL